MIIAPVYCGLARFEVPSSELTSHRLEACQHHCILEEMTVVGPKEETCLNSRHCISKLPGNQWEKRNMRGFFLFTYRN